jgi:hypothetical protein
MSAPRPESSGGPVAHFESPRALDTILYGGLAVGVLDGLAAVVSSALRGTSPVRVFQYIASGLLGPASVDGGLATALLGVLFHFLIASVAAAVYYRASVGFPILIRQAVVCGMIYGVAVYFVMSRIVVPLSAARQFPFSLTQVIIHILFVGLPVALLARGSARTNLQPAHA